MKLLLLLAGATVALSAAPANARHHSRHHASTMVCTKWRHGNCVAMHRVSRPMARHMARYRTGYVFGPSYGYTSYDALPDTYVTRYHLSPDYRYVYRDNYIYVVDPKTYAIERIISAIVH